MRTVGQADSRRGARNLLHGDHMREIAQLSAAVFLADRQSEDAEVSELAPEIGWKKVLLVDRSSTRGNFIRRKFVDRIAQHVDIFAEREVQHRHMAHWKLPGFLVSRPRRSWFRLISARRSCVHASRTSEPYL